MEALNDENIEKLIRLTWVRIPHPPLAGWFNPYFLTTMDSKEEVLRELTEKILAVLSGKGLQIADARIVLHHAERTLELMQVEWNSETREVPPLFS